MEETVLKKVKLGLQATAYQLGIANEGSFGPHPANPFIPTDCELMILMDLENDFYIIEKIVSIKTNFSYIEVKPDQCINAFLQQAKFPSHGLIVKSAQTAKYDCIFKGIISLEQLREAIKYCAAKSPQQLAHIETDMCANFNPTRRQVIRSLAFKLVRRLKTNCQNCSAPGWGLIAIEAGLACENCGAATKLIKHEVFGCAKCDYKIKQARGDGKKLANAQYFDYCNP